MNLEGGIVQHAIAKSVPSLYIHTHAPRKAEGEAAHGALAGCIRGACCHSPRFRRHARDVDNPTEAHRFLGFGGLSGCGHWHAQAKPQPSIQLSQSSQAERDAPCPGAPAARGAAPRPR